jgi:hypothetical protein
LLVSAELDSLACEYIDDEIAGIWLTNPQITVPIACVYIFLYYFVLRSSLYALNRREFA